MWSSCILLFYLVSCRNPLSLLFSKIRLEIKPGIVKTNRICYNNKINPYSPRNKILCGLYGIGRVLHMLLVGMDLVEVKRIEKSIQNPRFCKRVFGPAERAFLQKRGFSAQSAAASFCAKEAFAKALGTGVRGFSLEEVELLRGELGEPSLHLSGAAQRIAQERHLAFSVSVTHTREYAAAVVIGQECPEP